MRRTIVAIDAVHGPPDSFFFRGISNRISLFGAFDRVGELDLVDLFASLVGAIANFDIRIHVPVDT